MNHVTGIERVNANLKRLNGMYLSETKKAVGAESEIILGVSKKRTPKDTGYLRNSGYTSVNQDLKGKIFAHIGFSADYAAKVHETNLNYKVGGWKYLESAVNERKDEFFIGIANRLQRVRI